MATDLHAALRRPLSRPPLPLPLDPRRFGPPLRTRVLPLRPVGRLDQRRSTRYRPRRRARLALPRRGGRVCRPAAAAESRYGGAGEGARERDEREEGTRDARGGELEDCAFLSFSRDCWGRLLISRLGAAQRRSAASLDWIGLVAVDGGGVEVLVRKELHLDSVITGKESG